jgi:DNA-binding transcriptional ArsR family regulator
MAKRLRIHFTGEDLGRIRIAPGPDLMWELVNSAHLLQNRECGPVFDTWRRAARARLADASAARSLRVVCTLAPAPTPYFPDFLTPPGGSYDLATGLDTIAATPRRTLRAELTQLAATGRGGRPPAWLPMLARGDVEAITRVREALADYHRAAIGPYQPLIRARIDAETATLTRLLRSGGVEAALRFIDPRARWQYPVLELPYPVEMDMHLGGRGLLLVPSFFAVDLPTTFVDPDLPPVLVYPVEHDPRWLTPPRPRAGTTRALAALIGTTRGALLEELTEPRSTTELARRLAIAPSTASEHLTVLRAAALITTHRHGGHAVHQSTRLGVLLANSPCGREGGAATMAAPGERVAERVEASWRMSGGSGAASTR